MLNDACELDSIEGGGDIQTLEKHAIPLFNFSYDNVCPLHIDKLTFQDIVSYLSIMHKQEGQIYCTMIYT